MSADRAASVLARLLNHSRGTGENYNLLLSRFVIELYRNAVATPAKPQHFDATHLRSEADRAGSLRLRARDQPLAQSCLHVRRAVLAPPGPALRFPSPQATSQPGAVHNRSNKYWVSR